MGNHTRVPPSGKTISTRVVTSKLRHFSAWRGLKESCCASASFGNAAPAGTKVPAFKNKRLSIEDLLGVRRVGCCDDGHYMRGLARQPGGRSFLIAPSTAGE